MAAWQVGAPELTGGMMEVSRLAGTTADTADASVAPLIRYSGVSKEFESATGTLVVVRDINLDVRSGEILMLVGPSGCGKSTLLNLAAGLFPPSKGQVFYAQNVVAGINKRVGYMTQSDHLLPWRTVAGNIMAPLEIRSVGKAEANSRVDELIEQVGLSGFGNSYPSQISGGMRKRAALARLLAYDPDTLLMDEPFGALDAQLRLRLQVELRTLCKRLGKTILFVTHDLDEAVAVGDRCAVFSARPGSILEVVEVPLPRERNILRLRYDADYIRTCGRLWSLLAPEIGLETP